MKKILLVISSIILFTSCENEEKNFRSGNFELRQLTSEQKTVNSQSASYFLVFAEYKQRSEDIFKVKVFAKINGTYRFLDIPIEKIRVRLNSDTLSKPYLVINYNSVAQMDIDYLLGLSDCCYDISYEINCSENYLPEKLLPISL